MEKYLSNGEETHRTASNYEFKKEEKEKEEKAIWLMVGSKRVYTSFGNRTP
jgi:hypothetical protein